MKLDRLVLREGGNASSVTSLDDAMALILSRPTGRINVRGANGSGKSTLLTSLKAAVKTRAYYWPTADRLAFQFSQGQDEVETDEDGDPSAERREEGRLLVRRAAIARAAGDRQPHRRADLSARRMGRQSRSEQPGGGRRAGRTACPARPGGRDFAPGPDLKEIASMLTRRAALAGLCRACGPAARRPVRRRFRAAPSPSSCPTRPAGRSTRWRG